MGLAEALDDYGIEQVEQGAGPRGPHMRWGSYRARQWPSSPGSGG